MGFAVRAGVRPGDPDLTLTARPGATLRVVAKGPDGTPVPKAYANVSRVDGVALNVPHTGGGGPTDSSGFTQFRSPAGAVELQVNAERLSGTAQVAVAEGAVVDVEVTLREPGRKR